MRRLDPRWGPIWAVGTTTCCVVMALVLAVVGGDDEPAVDHAAQTVALLEGRGEPPAVVECIRNNDSYDLTAGPLTTVALQQLLSSCRAAADVVEAETGDAGVQTGGSQTDGSRPDGSRGDGGDGGMPESVLEVSVDDPEDPTSVLQVDAQTMAAELTRLRGRCAEGYGVDCDRLFALAPANSDDEAFGLSCGDRLTVIDCADLVPESQADETVDG